MTQTKENYSGIFRGHKLGYGFVASLNGDFDSDIFIPKTATLQAIEGDLVEVQVTSKASKKGWEGKVTQILERKHRFIGAIVTEVFQKKVLLLCPLLGLDKEVILPLDDQLKLHVGDRIVVQLKKAKRGQKKVEAIFESYIGNIKDPSADIEAATSEFVLRKTFPKKVLEYVDTLPNEIDPKKYPHHEDLTQLNCITIDPDTAKDFDDAISLEKSPKGHWVLGVHIADVSYFVKENSPLDHEAYLRCNSTYFPGKCLPMLPPKLSDNLCSLKPDVPRLTLSTFMTFDQEGHLIHHQIKRSIIKSQKRFTYKEVLQILEGKKSSKLKPLLEDLKSLALLLKEHRKKRGCIDMALSEAQVIVDSKGNPKGVEVIEYDITHQMIEEFMLKTNEVIAKHLSDRDIGLPYRVHHEPKPDQLKEFAALVDSYGFKLSNPPKQEELQNLFAEIKGCDYEHQLSVAFIRCMKLATYSPDNAGHYGLQLEHYCHFTSPIRRYVDLVIHRILLGDNNRNDLTKICEQCSDQERLSAKAENSVRTLKILRLLDKENSKTKKRPIYEGVVTKIKPYGLFFEIPFLLLEGFLHISKLGRDYYLFQEKSGSIIGRDRGELIKVGQSLKVQVQNLCLLTQEIEFKRFES